MYNQIILNKYMTENLDESNTNCYLENKIFYDQNDVVYNGYKRDYIINMITKGKSLVLRYFFRLELL